MAFHCSEIDTLIQTYLDGELSSQDLRDFEAHIAECEECRRKLRAERDFRRFIQRRLAETAPQAPQALQQRLRENLDAEDNDLAAARRRARLSWVLPGAATLAAAAALLLFITTNRTPVAEETIAEDAVMAHMRRPPVEVQGAGQVSPWIEQHFRPDVSVPRFSASNVSLRGARLSHLMGRDAAQLVYDVDRNSQRQELRVHIVDGKNLDLHAKNKRIIGGREVWVDGAYGFSTVTVRGNDGMSYVFTSEMDGDDLVDLVTSSDFFLGADTRR